MSEDVIVGLLSDIKAQLDRIESLLSKEEKEIREIESSSFGDVG